MTDIVQNASDIQKLAEQKELEQVGGALSENYIAADDMPVVEELEGTDSIQLSSELTTVLTSQQTSPAASVEGDEETYIENTNQYNDALDGSGPPPPPPPSPPPDDSGEKPDGDYGTKESALTGDEPPDGSVEEPPDGSSDGGDILDQISDVENKINSRRDGWKDEDFTIEGDYDGIDAEKLEEWARDLLTWANIMIVLMVAFCNKFETRRITEENITGIPLAPEGKQSYRKAISNKLQSIQRSVQMAIGQLFMSIQLRNQERFEEEMEKIRKEAEGGWFKVRNFWSGGHEAQQLNAKSMRETEKYLAATEKMLESMQAVINSMVNLFDAEGKGLGEAAIFMINMKACMLKFADEIGKLSLEVKASLDIVREELKRLEDDGGFWDSVGDFFSDLVNGRFDELWDDIKGMGKAIYNDVKNFFKALFKGDWKALIGEIKSWLRDFQDFLDRIYIGYALNFLLEMDQWALSLLQDPVETTLRICEIAWDVVAYAVQIVVTFFTFLFACSNIPLVALSSFTGDWFPTDKLSDFVDDGIDAGSEARKGIQKGKDWVHEKIRWAMSKISEQWDKLGWWKAAAGPFAFPMSLLTDPEKESPAYIDDFDIVDIIKEYRNGLVNAQNAYRMYISLLLAKSDCRNIVHKTMTGLTGIESNAELMMVAAESGMTHVTQMLDAATTQLMMQTNLHNTLVSSYKNLIQAQKAQISATIGVSGCVAAVVISFIVSIVTIGAGAAPAWAGTAMLFAAVAGLTSGLANAQAQDILADVDPYEPAATAYDPYDLDSDTTGSHVLDVLNRLEHEQEADLKAAAYNQGLYIQTKDELYTFNSKQFAAYEIKQNMLNNAIRVICSAQEHASDLRRIVHAELTGVAIPDSGAALSRNAIENILLQKQMLLSAIKFQHQEVLRAKNLAKQGEIAREKSTTGAMISILGAALGAFLGGLGSAWQLGMALGSGLASSAWQLYDALYGRGNALDMTLVDPCKDLEKLFTRFGDESIENKLDRAEISLYQQILAYGLISTGGGYVGVDFGLVMQMYERLKKIYMAKEMIASAKSMKSELRDVVKQQMTGLSAGHAGELSKTAIRASFSTAMKVMAGIVQFMQAKAMVHNRAVDAEKQYNVALGTFIANLAIAAAGAGTAAATPAGSIANTVANASPSLMGLVNSLASIITSAMAYNSDLGDYEGYNAKTTVDSTGQRVGNPDSIDEKLDKMEYDILCSMNQSLLEILDGGNMTVSASAAKLSSRMLALYRIKEVLAIARSAAAECREICGGGSSSSDYGRGISEIQKQASLAMLDSLKSALDIIAQRESQMNQAQKGIWLSSISAAFSAASIGFRISAASMQGEANQLAEEAKGGSEKAATDQKTVEDSIRAQRVTAGILSMVGNFITVWLDVIYDWGRNADKGKAKDPEAGSSLEREEDKKEKGDGEKGDFYSSLADMDAEIAQSQYKLSVYQNNAAAMSYVAQRNEKIMQWFLDLPQQFCNIAMTAYPQKKELPYPDPKISESVEEKYEEAIKRRNKMIDLAEKIQKDPNNSAAREEYQKLLAEATDSAKEIRDLKLALVNSMLKNEDKKGASVATPDSSSSAITPSPRETFVKETKRDAKRVNEDAMKQITDPDAAGNQAAKTASAKNKNDVKFKQKPTKPSTPAQARAGQISAEIQKNIEKKDQGVRNKEGDNVKGGQEKETEPMSKEQIKFEIEMLKKELVEKRAQLDKIIRKHNTLREKVRVKNEATLKDDMQLQNQIREMKAKLAEIKVKIKNANPQQESKLVRLAKDLETNIKLAEFARVKLPEDAKAIAEEAKGVKGKIDALRGEVATLNRRKGQLEGQLRRIEKKEGKKPGSSNNTPNSGSITPNGNNDQKEQQIPQKVSPDVVEVSASKTASNAAAKKPQINFQHMKIDDASIRIFVNTYTPEQAAEAIKEIAKTDGKKARKIFNAIVTRHPNFFTLEQQGKIGVALPVDAPLPEALEQKKVGRPQKQPKAEKEVRQRQKRQASVQKTEAAKIEPENAIVGAADGNLDEKAKKEKINILKSKIESSASRATQSKGKQGRVAAFGKGFMDGFTKKFKSMMIFGGQAPKETGTDNHTLDNVLANRELSPREKYDEVLARESGQIYHKNGVSVC